MKKLAQCGENIHYTTNEQISWRKFDTSERRFSLDRFFQILPRKQKLSNKFKINEKLSFFENLFSVKLFVSFEVSCCDAVAHR